MLLGSMSIIIVRVCRSEVVSMVGNMMSKQE